MMPWKLHNGTSSCGSVVTNLTGIHEDSGSIPGPVQWVKGYGIAVSCDICCSYGSCSILGLRTSYAVDVAIKQTNKQKEIEE